MDQLNSSNIKNCYGKSGVYFFSVKGHSYVGSSVNVGSRLHNHIWSMSTGRHRNRFVQKCYDKYSISAFTFKILEFCSKEIRIEREKYYIDLLKPDMNVVEPVSLSRNKPEYIERQRKIKLEYYKTHTSLSKIPVYQYTKTGEYVQSFNSATDAANYYSVNVSAIVSATNNRSITCCGFQWRKTKYEQISSCTKQKPIKKKNPQKPGNRKIIYRYSLDGKYIDSFESASLADRTLRIKGCSAAARGNTAYRSVGGFLWSYKKEDSLPPYKNHSKDAKKIAIILTNTLSGKEYCFDSIAEAARTLFPNEQNYNSLCACISSCARGKGKRVKKIYTAKYK